MTRRKILVALITQDNDYQKEQAAVAESTARRLDVDVTVVFANGDAITQTQQILSAIRVAADRPDAIVVEPVGTGMLGVAKSAAQAGCGWIVLNREADYLKAIRESSTAPIGSVDCDNVEVGRIQGRQFAALLPSGGSVLYVEGPPTDVSKQRRAGMEETLPSNIEIKLIRGRWTEESAFLAVNPWLQLESKRQSNIGVIGCQNDAMAMGARRAVEGLSDAVARERLLKTPFTGVDGVRETGQAWVQKGLMAATVVTPALTGLAIEMLVKSFATGTQVPERTLTKPTSFPLVEKISARKM
jgi:ribose transport system substrate-binding protein